MAKCSYEISLSTTEMWDCPRKALPGEERCYWHKEEDGKAPAQEMLKELKKKVIFGAHLKKAKLQNKDLIGVKIRNANLNMAELHNSDLFGAEISNSNLWFAKMRNLI